MVGKTVECVVVRFKIKDVGGGGVVACIMYQEVGDTAPDLQIAVGILVRAKAKWCLLFVLIRQGLRGGSEPLRLIRALVIETGNPIMTLARSSFLPSFERAPHHTSPRIP